MVYTKGNFFFTQGRGEHVLPEQAAMETNLVHGYLVQFLGKRGKKNPHQLKVLVLTSLCLVLVRVGIVC